MILPPGIAGGGGDCGAAAPMIPVPSGVGVWLADGRTDMRRGMNGFALQVQQAWLADILRRIADHPASRLPPAVELETPGHRRRRGMKANRPRPFPDGY